MKRLAWAAVSLSLAGFIACSGTEGGDSGAGGAGPTSGAGPTTGNGPTSGNATTGSGPSTSTSTTTGTTTGGGDDCSMMATWEECDECVCTKNQAGCDAYYTLEDENCYCGSSAPCAAQCGEYCTNDNWDTACDTCATGLDDTCYDAAYTACEADSACAAFINASSAACDALPDP